MRYFFSILLTISFCVFNPISLWAISIDTIRVNKFIDLQGKKKIIRDNAVLLFEGGTIVNGCIEGHGTRISGNVTQALGCKLEGSWLISNISDNYFIDKYLTDIDILSNINNLQSDDIQQNIRLMREKYNLLLTEECPNGIILSSNTNLYINSSIELVGNSLPSYSIVYISHKKNILVSGGIICGDVGNHKYILGTTSEWGMGVRIMESSNVAIRNITVKKCIGDGIYISGGNEKYLGCSEHASTNISIDNVVCEANRRQGISIIHVNGLKLKDCVFCNTGVIERTSPGAGCDIEPNYSKGRRNSVQNVFFERCTFWGSKSSQLTTNGYIEENNKSSFNNIVFQNCKINGKATITASNITFRNSYIQLIQVKTKIYQPHNIDIINCTVSDFSGRADFLTISK